MTPERWQRIETISEAARELELEWQSAFLDQECGDDPELRSEVEKLLQANLEQVGFLEEPLVALGGKLPPRIGRYRILGELGSGGMATVYKAVASDDIYQQPVALKVIKRGQETAVFVRRFKDEGRTLAALDHPYIARLLNGGSTPNGRPFLAMELLEGLPLDQFCKTSNPPLDQRLVLFLKICEAVTQAHRQLILHRDLKPSNILITAGDQPKLLDFGISKWLEPEAAEAPTLTVAANRHFTPQYASPEQVGGEGMGVTSDVYSLGTLLYFVLTGKLPLQLDSSNPIEIQRLICEKEPDAPSIDLGRSERTGEQSQGNVTSRISAKQLQGDLDTIVLKALRKEPHRRYQSVEHLAEDLQRYLKGEPIRARKSTKAYRLRKFLRRHWRGVGITTAAFLLLLLFTVNTAIQQQQTSRERNKYEFVSRFLLQLFEGANPKKGLKQDVTAGELLNEGRLLLQEQTQGQPLLRADLQTKLGEAYYALGDFQSARDLFSEALGLREAEAGRNSLEAADTINNLAVVLTEQGHLEEANSLFQEALDTLQSAANRDHPLRGEVLHNYSTYLFLHQELDAVEKPLKQALEIRRKAWGNQSAEVAESLGQLATLMKYQERFDTAEPIFREVLEIRLSLFGENHPATATTLHNFAWFLDGVGRDEEAEKLYLRALAARRNRLGPDHPDVANTLYNMSGLYGSSGRHQEADDASAEATAIWKAALGPDHPRVAFGLNSQAVALRRLGDVEAAESLFRETLSLRQRVLGPDHIQTSISLNNLGYLMQDLGRHEEAMALYQQALAIRRQHLGDTHSMVALTISNIGSIHEDMGRYQVALESYSEGRKIREDLFGSDHPDTIGSQANIASALLALGELEDATALAEDTLEQLLSLPTPKVKALAQAKSILGACRAAEGQLEEATRLLESAVKELVEADGPESRNAKLARARLRSLSSSR